MQKQKILFVEDDPVVGTLIMKGLTNAGMEVCLLNTLNGFREILTGFHPDLLILDLEVSERNSMEELPFIRSIFPTLPVIIASSHTSGKEIGKSFDAGVNYYIKKPYELEELLSIARKLCPVKKMEPEKEKEVEPTKELRLSEYYRLNLVSRELFYSGERVCKLNPKEYRLLTFLISKPGKVLYRPELLEEVWHNPQAGDSLNNCISNLRSFLKKDPRIRIETISKKGYRYTKR